MEGSLYFFSEAQEESIFILELPALLLYEVCVLLLQVCGCVCCCPARRPAVFRQIPPPAAGFLLTYPQLATFWLASDRGANADSVNRRLLTLQHASSWSAARGPETHKMSHGLGRGRSRGSWSFHNPGELGSGTSWAILVEMWDLEAAQAELQP